MVDSHPKSKLLTSCQRYLGRPLLKEDVVWTMDQMDDGGYQCTVHLLFMKGAAYVGEVGENEKVAEANAASQALTAMEPVAANIPASKCSIKNKKRAELEKKKRALGEGAGTGGNLKNIQQIIQQLQTSGSPDLAAAAASVALQMPVAAVTGASSSDLPKPLQAKTDLNGVLTRIIRRGLQKGEVVYTHTSASSGAYQCMLTLNCLPGVWCGKSWVGEVASTKQLAEQAAAAQAYATLVKAPEFALALLQQPKANQFLKKREAFKRKYGETSGGDNEANEVLTSSYGGADAKASLLAMIRKITKRPLSKEDATYVTQHVGSGFQSTVTLNGLPGEFAGSTCIGEVCVDMKLAEQSAAQAALTNIQSTPQLLPLISASSSQVKVFPNIAPKSKPKQEHLPPNRQVVSEDPMAGDVVAWNGSGGFVQPRGPVNHERSQQRGGKIYFSRKDLIDGEADVHVGSVLVFKVCVENSATGLVASEVTVV